MASRCRSASTPRPVTVDTGRISAASSTEAATAERISAATSTSRACEARSALVSATSPRLTPRRSRIARCSSVWGMTPSSAATTSSAKSTPLAPATIVRTKRS
ncbi:MAG TPA: hypothetical protein VHY34_06290 [Caulobacteraceae bacterium]|nr:hypothetical protein [Caulobacteraceae bacterium]